MARQVGLRDLSIATLTKDDKTGVTYGAVEKLERSVSAKVTPKSNSENLYSDDAIEDVAVNMSQIDVEIELNQLTIASRAKIFGSKIVNGILIENANDVTTSPYVALIFKSKKLNGAFRYVCLLKGKFELVGDDYNTQEEKIKASTAKIKGTFMTRTFDENFRLMADSDNIGVNVTDLEQWFTTVPEIPTVSNITTISVAIGKTAIVTNVTGTILTVATGTTVSSLISAIIVDNGKGSFKVYTNDSKSTEATISTTVASTMVVETTAEDTKTKATYTITLA